MFRTVSRAGLTLTARPLPGDESVWETRCAAADYDVRTGVWMDAESARRWIAEMIFFLDGEVIAYADMPDMRQGI